MRFSLSARPQNIHHCQFPPISNLPGTIEFFSSHPWNLFGGTPLCRSLPALFPPPQAPSFQFPRFSLLRILIQTRKAAWLQSHLQVRPPRLPSASIHSQFAHLL